MKSTEDRLPAEQSSLHAVPPKLVFLVIGLVAAVALPGIAARATYGAQVTADEPQYLLTALSLGIDGNLDIDDELAAREFEPFHEVGLNPQTIDLNERGQRLSPHDPLLPLILALPMKWGGWQMAKATLAMIGALTAGLTVIMAVRLLGCTLRTASLVVAGGFTSPPLVSYSTQVYPEIVAALAVVSSLLLMFDSPGRQTAWSIPLRWWRLGGVCVAIIALPWLAVKYVPVAVVITLLLGWRERRLWFGNRLVLLGVGLMFALAAVAYVVFHQRVYGGWTVYAAGDHFVDGEFRVVGSNPDYLGRSRRLIGLIVDAQFGLAAWAPAWLALIPALATVVPRLSIGSLRRGPASTPTAGPGSGVRLSSRGLLAAVFDRHDLVLRVGLVGIVAGGWATAVWIALTMHGWWWPGRQLVVVLPVALAAIAALVERHKALLWPVMVGWGLGIVSWTWLVFETSTDRLTLIVDFADTTNPWYRTWSTILPDHQRMNSADVALTVVWAVLLAGLSVESRRRFQRKAIG